ncbi:MAG: energy-coupling factor ABC transporter permease [Ignavibacteriales bacterium]|nr:energy-coupling factor ABC transporter permease [Ignavibacteriales bacterium]
MHIPDGFLDTKTAIATATISTVGISFAFRHLKKSITPQEVPLVGLAAAFVFVSQMLNFPIAAGTSGHFMGAGLLTVLLGPSAAIIVMSSVLVVQCFLFSDGGLTALGANIFNMAIAGSLVSYGVLKGIELINPNAKGKLIGTAVASWSATVVASILCAGELAWSNSVSWGAAFTAMANIHMIIGIAEGAIATIVLAGIWRARPEIIERAKSVSTIPPLGTKIIYILLIAIGIFLFFTPFISELPDGLEKVASTLGFDQNALSKPLIQSPFSEYQFSIFGSSALATISAGLIGLIIVYILSTILARMLISKIRS